MNATGASYIEVWCWADDNQAVVAWLEDVEDYDPYTNVGTEFIEAVDPDLAVGDPDIVLTADGFIMVVFLEIDGSDWYPSWALFEFDNGAFTQIDKGYLESTHTDAFMPNIDINDNDEIVAVWQNDGSIWGRRVNSYGSGGATWDDPIEVAAASGNSLYRWPDVCIHHDGDQIVSVVYVEEISVLTDNRKLWVKQYELADFVDGGGGPIGSTLHGTLTFNGMNDKDDYWYPPRITAPNSSVSSCATDCEDDYALAVVMYDGAYWIEAHGEFESSTTFHTVNRNAANNWNIAGGGKNTAPVVAWPDGGVIVAWMLDIAGGYSGDVPIAPLCDPPLPVSVGNPSSHILVEYLNDDLSEWSTDNTLSLFNKFIDANSWFWGPSISDGDNMSSGDSVLYFSFWEGPTNRMVTKRNAFGTTVLKRGPGSSDDFLTRIGPYPNPFCGSFSVRAEALDFTPVAVRFFDAQGREHLISYDLKDDSVEVTISGKLAPGAYTVQLIGNDRSKAFVVFKQ